MIGYKRIFMAIGCVWLAAMQPIAIFASEIVSDNNIIYDDLEDFNDEAVFPPTVSGNEIFPDDTPVHEVGSDASLSSSDFVSGNSLPDDSSEDDGLISPYSSYNTYYGVISTSYLEYMRGYLGKLSPTQHYVGARTGQYEYIFAYGDSLSFSGSLFSGTDVMVLTWYTNGNGSFSHSMQSSFSLSPGSYLVYSDLTDIYPSLADSSAVSLRQLVFVSAIFISFWTFGQFMRRSGTAFIHRRRGR